MANTTVVKIRRLISNNKAIAAALTSFTGVELAALATWIQTGKFDAAETRTAVGGLLLSLGTFAVTWLVSAGDAEVVVPQTPPVEPPVGPPVV
jgi:hypothetical protein